MTDLANNEQQQPQWRSLVRKSDFQKVYEHGAKKVGRLVVVYLLLPVGGPSGQTEAGREYHQDLVNKPDLARAVVASKKVGGAVARNRAKRLMREARRLGSLGDPDQIRQISDRFLGEPGSKKAPEANETHSFAGLWVVLVARRRILSASSREVRDELDTLLAGDET